MNAADSIIFKADLIKYQDYLKSSSSKQQECQGNHFRGDDPSEKPGRVSKKELRDWGGRGVLSAGPTNN